jgi:hypothetical protein
MENVIIFKLLLVSVFGVGLYISSKIMESIEGSTQHKKLLKNLRDFDMRDIMDKSEKYRTKK